MDALRAYSAFVRTFEAGNFSAVARELGTSQSAISKQIASLEDTLGVQLFTRTTRSVQPTAEALQIYEHVRQLLDAVESLKAPRGQRAAPTGLLRVSAPSSYGRHRLCPALPRYQEQHPKVRVEMTLSDDPPDLVEEGFELGIRIGPLPPSTLMARRIGSVDYQLVASADYLKRRGTPEWPIDLADHDCILTGGRTARWEFDSEDGRQAVAVSGRTSVSDPDAVYALARSHQGIALVPRWVVGDDVARGAMRGLLRDHYPLASPLSVVYPSTRYLSLRARTFLDFLVGEQRDGRLE